MSRMDFSFNWPGNLSMSRHADINQSLNQSNFVTETSKHKVKVYESLLPVLVVEAISTESLSFQSLSVKISEHGWAWLVCGRRLFVWKYKCDSKRPESPCFELELPPSDLSHKAELVTLLLPTQTGEKRDKNIVSVVVVSPEGTLRYWPNVAYESHSIETSVSDLHGEECFMLANIDLTTCVLGTTTNTLVCININARDSAAPIHFRTLRAPQGVLAGFSKRVSSFIFGAVPAAHSQESRLLVRIAPVPEDEEQDSDTQSVAVLAGTVLQKWLLFANTEQLLFEYDLDKTLRNAFLERVWSNRAPLPNQLQIWCADLCVRHANQYTLLVACSNAEYPSQLHFAIAVCADNSETITQLVSFNLLNNHAMDVRGSHEEVVNNTHLLIGPPESSLIYVYDHAKVLCVQGAGSEVIDVIDFGQRDDGILGAGFDANGIAMLFTFRDALVSLIPSGVRDNLSSLGFSVPRVQIQAPSEDDKLAKLASAFHHYCKKETSHAVGLLQSAFSDSSGTPLVSELNAAVVEFSTNLLDAQPSTDPRWAESDPRALSGALTASIIIGKQIEEKLSNHLQLIDFLKGTPYWTALQARAGNYPPTQLILYEHLEKLTCAYSLKCKQATLSYLLDPVIKQLVEKRGQLDRLKGLLTPQDAFYREITKVHDIFAAVVDFEASELSDARFQNTSESYNLVASFSDMLVAVFQEVAVLRHNIEHVYAAFTNNLDDYTPWDASVEGPDGVRHSLLKQVHLLVDRGFVRQTTPDEDIEFKSGVYQRVADLTESLLGSYAHQLKLLQRDSNVRTSVQQKFEADRNECLMLLLRAKQFERAKVLAEKYFDFDVLIRVCEELDDKEPLKNYCQMYAEYNFAEYLFNWYMKHGKQAKMLTTALPADPSLDGFLRQHEQLQWLHQIHSNRFEEASQTLLTLSANETHRLDRKKTLLSLSKLAALAGTQSRADVKHIDEQLENVLTQESQLMAH